MKLETRNVAQLSSQGCVAVNSAEEFAKDNQIGLTRSNLFGSNTR